MQKWKVEGLKARVNTLKDGVQAAMDKAAEKLHDQLRPTHEDTEALNETVTQAGKEHLKPI